MKTPSGETGSGAKDSAATKPGRRNSTWKWKQAGVFLTEYNALELNVSPGEVLKVHDIVNGFAMAETPDGRLGWVPLKNLSQIKSRPS
jgi:hypothetical protein